MVLNKVSCNNEYASENECQRKEPEDKMGRPADYNRGYCI